MNVRLFKPSVGKEELENIKDSFDKSWIGLGPKVKEFEKRWSEFIKTKSAIGVNSATAALHLAVSAYKFPRNKKVLVPALTFASTAMAPIYNNLTPVFVDIDKDNLNISLEDLDGKYDKDCVAVMPVHYCGHPVRMDELTDWAKSKNLAVIEDCAHTAGGEYKGKKLGAWGDIGCFSFEEKKCMTTGDGGMIVSNNEELIEPLKASRWVGINKNTWQRVEENAGNTDPNLMHWYYEINDLGFKYNMNDLAASIGLMQLEKLPAMNKKRSEIINKYISGINFNENIQPALPYTADDKSSYQMFILNVKNRDHYIQNLKSRNIATGVHYMPLHFHPYFNQFKSDTPFVDKVWQNLLTIPLHVDLTDEEINYVISTINDIN